MKPASFLTQEFIDALDLENPNYDLARSLIIDAYNKDQGTSLPLDLPSDNVSLIPIVSWLNKLHGEFETGFWLKYPKLTSMFTSSLSDKISILAQSHCYSCKCDFPIITFPIRIRPRSYQASNKDIKKAFKRAFSERLEKSHDFKDSRVCIQIVLIVNHSSRTGDIDNVTKLVLDSMKGVLFADDEQVDHLNIMRVYNQGNEDFIYIRISNSTLNQHQDVFYSGIFHSWDGMQSMINLDDYMQLN